MRSLSDQSSKMGTEMNKSNITNERSEASEIATDLKFQWMLREEKVQHLALN